MLLSMTPSCHHLLFLATSDVPPSAITCLATSDALISDGKAAYIRLYTSIALAGLSFDGKISCLPSLAVSVILTIPPPFLTTIVALIALS